MPYPDSGRPANDGADGKTIISSTDFVRVVDRIAHQILEKTDGARGTILLGVPTLGAVAALMHATSFGVSLVTVLVFLVFYAWKCMNCGAIIDRTISNNRQKSLAARKTQAVATS